MTKFKIAGLGYDDVDGFHCHQCPKCKTIWRHFEGSRYMAAHNCPDCGTHESWKCDLTTINKEDVKYFIDIKETRLASDLYTSCSPLIILINL